MSETESEKVLKDTLCRMQHDRFITLGLRNNMGGRNYSAKAPIDFTVIDVEGDTHWLEVKEVGRPTLPYGQFDEQQRHLLHVARNAWCLLRFYDGEHTKAHSCYWEEWFVVDGCLAPEEGEHGSLGVTRLLENVENSQLKHHIAGYQHGQPWGFSDDAGRTTRGNDSVGLTEIPFIEEGG